MTKSKHLTDTERLNIEHWLRESLSEANRFKTRKKYVNHFQRDSLSIHLQR